MIPFEFEADCGFFSQLLCREGETLDDYAELFDFDPPAAKRAAFANIRGDILRQRLADSANPLPAPGRACPDSIGGSVSVSEPG